MIETIKSIIQFVLNGFWDPTFFYAPWNTVPAGGYYGVNINLYLYAFIFLFLLGALLYRAFTSSCRRPVKEELPLATHLLIIVFAGVLIVHTISQTRYFVQGFEWAKEKKLTSDHPHFGSLVYTFLFSKYCKIHLPGHHAGYLISNNKNTSTLEQYVLAYYLYPEINIIENNARRPDCYIVFLKPDPERYVPKGFKIIGKFGANSLIAVRE